MAWRRLLDRRRRGRNSAKGRREPRPAAPDLRTLRNRLLAERGVVLVVDGGAFDGRWAQRLRESGYAAAIASFEPLATAFAELARKAEHDPAWSCERVALASAAGTATLHVAGNAYSSSLLRMGRRHEQAAPDSAVIGTEQVRIARLDDALGAHAESGPAFIKLDLQGGELEALAGAPRTLARTVLVELELSLVELYSGQALLPRLFDELVDAGFECIGLEPEFWTPAGRMLQVNGLFERPPGSAAAG
jgi:FkbM family methyltransferase